MANYVIEHRTVFDKPYLKVRLRNNDKLEIIQTLLSELQSIKKVNITENKRTDMTIYPSEFYSAEETAEETVQPEDQDQEIPPHTPAAQGIPNIWKISWQQI